MLLTDRKQDATVPSSDTLHRIKNVRTLGEEFEARGRDWSTLGATRDNP
ncbi:hypothetical protein LINGRAHAP2_LOCUS27979 [Linum grandiflorum]